MIKKRAIKLFATVFLAITLFAFCGGSKASGTVDFSYSMKSEAVISFLSEQNETEFYATIENNIKGINLISGDDDIVKLISVSKTNLGYDVKLSLRRIDKLKGVGTFDFSALNNFFIEGSERRRLMENWSNGVWRYSGTAAINGERGHIDVSREQEGKTEVLPKNAQNQTIAFENFISETKNKSDLKCVSFFMPALNETIGEIDFLTLKIDGKIEYYAGNGIEKIDENTVKLTPRIIKADVTETNESGEPVVEKNADIQIVYGYLAFSQGLSPVAIGLICLGGALLAALIIFTIIKLIKLGKKSRSEIIKKVGENKNVSDNKSASDISEECLKTEKILKKNDLSLGFYSFFNGKKWGAIKKYKLMYLIALPAVAIIAIFCYAPMFGLVIAFQDYKLLEGVWGSEWVGFKTFYNLLINPDTQVYRLLRNTLYISVIRIGTNFPMILIFALLLREIKSNKARSAIQTISYIPNFISWVAVSGIAYNLFSKYGGLFNRIIEAFGGETIDFYTVEDAWWYILAVSSLWKGMGWCTLIYMSTMGTIDGELYDACLIDGGGRWQQATVVTIPGLANVIAMQLLLDSASILGDSADQILAMTNGASISKVNVIGTSMIANITGGGDLAVSTALGLVQGIVGLLMVLLTNSVVKKTENEGIL